MSNDTFCFIMHPKGDESKIEVCDLAHCVDYERNDWRIAVDKNFDSAEEACKYARAIAKKYSLTYVPFSSRYGDDYDDTELTDPGVLYLTPEEEAAL